MKSNLNIKLHHATARPFNGKGWRVNGYVNGKVKQYWFATEAEAQTDCRDRNLQLASHRQSLEMSALNRADALNALALSKPYAVSLLDAAQHYVSFARAKAASKALDAFVREYKIGMQSRVDAGALKPGALKAAKETFVKITDRFGSMLFVDITAAEIAAWLNRMDVAQRTRERHRSYTVQIFNAAKRARLIVVNPAEQIETYKSDDQEPSILAPKQVEKLLHVACDETRPLYAIASVRGTTMERD